MVLKLKSWSQLEMKLWNQKNPDTSYQPYQPYPYLRQASVASVASATTRTMSIRMLATRVLRHVETWHIKQLEQWQWFQQHNNVENFDQDCDSGADACHQDDGNNGNHWLLTLPQPPHEAVKPAKAKARHNFWREVVEPLPNGFQFPTRIHILINLHFGLTLANTICRLLLLLFPHLPNVESVFNQSNDPMMRRANQCWMTLPSSK